MRWNGNAYKTFEDLKAALEAERIKYDPDYALKQQCYKLRDEGKMDELMELIASNHKTMQWIEKF